MILDILKKCWGLLVLVTLYLVGMVVRLKKTARALRKGQINIIRRNKSDEEALKSHDKDIDKFIDDFNSR